ncbi:methyl-accepting chemotaxis protein [Athalassotoga saccharophila]|uniref:methyl-accepting chemotaxis protein n=1 Tax=Athalassotoga saccharophila TaxID=1441386 RepID=UPI00137B3357|nr:methyl-accepting chemotaxis protein [Athalassotoga saccharophila]BBJ27365.1 methyl-accepting chemotaxis protein 4 [Athalassotoga saccharophila]
MRKVQTVLYVLLALLVIDSAFAILFKDMRYVLITSLVTLGVAVLLAILSYIVVIKPMGRLNSKTAESERLDIVELSKLDKDAGLRGLGLKIGALFEKIRLKLKDLFKGIRLTAVDNSTVARNLKSFSKEFNEMENSLKKVNASVQNISAAIEELNASIEQVASSSQTLAKSAQELSETSNGVSDNASKGEKALKETGEKMEDFKSKVSQISDQAKALTNYVNLINEAVSVISSISDQTNLLALNAAIEAARAGDAGKGFAVVADEIRKLAEESKNAALKIGNNLKDVISGIGEISQNISSVNDQLTQILKNNEETTSTIVSILDSVKTMNSPISGIAASAEEFSASAEEMTAASKNITDMSTEVSGAMGLIEEKINDISSRLGELVSNAEKSIAETQKIVGELTAYTIYSKAEFADQLQEAINAHKNWLNRLESAVQNEKVVDLETDPHRCNFGILMYSVTPPDEIKSEWQRVESLHASVHEYGGRTLAALESKNLTEARQNLSYAESSANELIKLLGDLQARLR